MNKESNHSKVEASNQKRPLIVTIICGFLLFGFICLPSLFATAYSQSNLSWLAKFNIAFVILQGVFAIGMLRMKRWGFIGFFALVATSLAIGQWNLLVIKNLLILVIGGICYLLYRAMPRRRQNSGHPLLPPGNSSTDSAPNHPSAGQRKI